MGDLNFMISTEGLTEKGKMIGSQSDAIKEAINDINAARASLEGWVSENKGRYDEKLLKTLSMMDEMTQVIDSYKNVALQTSARAINVENKIAAAIENDDIPA